MNDPRHAPQGAGGPSARLASFGEHGGLRLAEHTHAGHIYESPDEQLDVVVAFFRPNLDGRHRCVYAHNHADETAAIDALIRAGLGETALVGTSLELVDRRQLPSVPGAFNVNGVMSFLESRIEDAVQAGYEGLRGVGDMVWTLPADPTHERLFRYESRVTGALNAAPGAVICQYDRRLFDDAALFDVLCTHRWLVISGTLCQNPYYVPEGSFEERDRGDLDIDIALGNILARERQERWLAATEGDLAPHRDDAVDVARLASIYEHMRDYKVTLRDKVRWRLRQEQRPRAARCEVAALDGEISWLEQQASLWRRRELQSSGLCFDPVNRALTYRGRAVGLSRLEVDLLRELLYQAGRPIHAAQLLRIAWEREIRTEAQLRNYIGRLRGKLEMLDVPASIDSVRGRGYRLTTTTGSTGTD